MMKLTDEQLDNATASWKNHSPHNAFSVLGHIDAITQELREAKADLDLSRKGTQHRHGETCTLYKNERLLREKEVTRLKQPMSCGHPAACLVGGCETCGERFTDGSYSHGRSEEGVGGQEVEVECGPVSDFCSACESERAAVLKEREDCLEICWDHQSTDRCCGREGALCSGEIAKLIRSRSGE